MVRTVRPGSSRAVAAAAIALLNAIAAAREPADRVIHSWMRQHHKQFEAAERQAIIHLTEEVLRQRGRLDWWIDRSSQSLEPTMALRVVAFRMLSTGAKAEGLRPLLTGLLPEDDPKAAAIDSLLRKLESRTLEHPDMPRAARWSIPAWIEPRFAAAFGADLDLELAAALRPAPVDLRVNTLKTTRAAAQAALVAEGQRPQPTPLSPLGLRLPPSAYVNNGAAYGAGLVEPQDEGSQIAAQLVEAAGCRYVVDFCAGAGGKSLAIGAAMGNAGRLLVCDVSEARLAQARLRLRRAGVHNAECRPLEAKWLKRQAGLADRVLVDAPCSGTGTWRRKPDARWRLTEQDIAELVVRQAEILDRAAKLVKTGGRLVYVTCSVLPEENADQVTAFLGRHPDFALLPVAEVWARTVGGACPTDEPCLKLTPARQGTDGFFVAILEKRGKSPIQGD